MNLWAIKNPWKRKTLLVLVTPYVVVRHFWHAMTNTFWPNLRYDMMGAWKGPKNV